MPHTMSRIKRNELEGALDETSWAKTHGLEAIGLAIYLAREVIIVGATKNHDIIRIFKLARSL